MRHRSVSQTCVSHPCEKNRTGLVLCLRPIIKPDLPFVILDKPVGTKCRLKLLMHKHQWRRQSLSTNEPKDISLWGHGEGKWAEKKRKTLIFNDCLHHTQWLSGWVQTPYSQLLVCFKWHLGLPWFSHLRLKVTLVLAHYTWQIMVKDSTQRFWQSSQYNSPQGLDQPVWVPCHTDGLDQSVWVIMPHRWHVLRFQTPNHTQTVNVTATN